MTARSGKPALPRLIPPIALVREQRSVTAQAGGALLLPSTAESQSVSVNDSTTGLNTLRTDIRARRSALDDTHIETWSSAIAARAWRIPALSRSRRIACYFSVNGEVSCRKFVHQAWRRGRDVFLPVLQGDSLRFAQFRPETVLNCNRFGIPEPACSTLNLVHPRFMDVVLVPLVACDPYGNRIGMGAGCYDRSFHFLHRRSVWLHPKLIGLAYDFQIVNRLQPNAFDVPMYRVVTETNIYPASRTLL